MEKTINEKENVETTPFFDYGPAGLTVVVVTTAGIMSRVEHTQRQPYQKTQQALGDAPREVQQAIDSFEGSWVVGNTAQMNQSIDTVTLAQSKIQSAYTTFTKETGITVSDVNTIEGNLRVLYEDARWSLDCMKYLQAHPKEEGLLRDGQYDQLETLKGQSYRIKMHAGVQHQIDITANGTIEQFYSGVSLAFTVVAGFLLAKGIRASRRNKRRTTLPASRE